VLGGWQGVFKKETDFFQNWSLKGMIMGFRTNLKVIITYLKDFPSPTFLQKHHKLTHACQELEDRVDRLTRENAWLKKKRDLEGAYTHHNGAYFFETPDGQTAPYCSQCWDAKGRLVKLETGANGRANCPQCNTRDG
jgi:hypothetical protein